ncbi:hypothetical protein HYY69_06815 [Candidatus Woesearchaeota archaeon]|nr:hypothetical protein [Candidatus Woesearchaeota archaeon]
MFDNKNSQIKHAFNKVKSDISGLNANMQAIKANSNDWIMYLNAENKQLQVKVIQLETRLKLLEETIQR